jgi:HAD superfamily hydrolase (TIGR01509 family)
MKMISAVLFDLDGLIVDSEPWQFESLKKVLKEFGYSLTKSEFISQWVQEGYSYEKAIMKYNLKTTPEEIRKRKLQHYSVMIKEKMKLMPGAKETLALLKGSFKLALVTNSNKPDIELIFRKFGLSGFYDVILTWEDYVKRKPDPECYLMAARLLGASPAACVVIEDSIRGVNAAKNAGMKVIAVPNSFTKDGDFSGADIVVKNLGEITLGKIGEL